MGTQWILVRMGLHEATNWPFLGLWLLFLSCDFFLSYDLLYMMVTETLTTSEQIPIPSFNNPLKYQSLHYHCQLKKQRQIPTKALLDTASDYIEKNRLDILCVFIWKIKLPFIPFLQEKKNFTNCQQLLLKLGPKVNSRHLSASYFTDGDGGLHETLARKTFLPPFQSCHPAITSSLTSSLSLPPQRPDAVP